MKALTIKQPWASLICEGIKDVENRTWKCPKKYIGKRILIHAGLNKKENWKSLSFEQIMSLKNTAISELKVSELPHGSIIGSVEIVDCVINYKSIWAEKSGINCYKLYMCDKINKNSYCSATIDTQCSSIIYNWILANPILFDNHIENVKGKLSFWNFK